MAQLENEGLYVPQVLSTALRNTPGESRKSSEPFNIYEDVYIDPARELGDPYSLDTVMPEEEEDPYDFQVGTEDPFMPIDGEDPFDLSIPAKSTTADLTQDKWKPQTFEEYAQESMAKEKEINWTGAVENSFIRHGFEWAMSASDPDYVSPLSKEGRLIAIAEIDKRLQDMGEVMINDYEKIRESKELWDQKYGLQLQNYLDEQMETAELPSVGEFIELISSDWEGFGKSMLQEIVNKPELIFVPQFAAARGVVVAAAAGRALNVSAKAAQVLKVSGYATGAYVGGVTLGTLDGIAESQTKTGDYELSREFEQAQLDGILGMVLSPVADAVGTAASKTLTKAVVSARGSRELNPDVIAKANKIDLDSMDDVDLESVVRDPHTQSFIDDHGNVYTFEARETVDTIALTQDLKDLQKNLKDYKDDPVALSAIKGEMDAIKKRLSQEELDAGEISYLGKKLTSLSKVSETLKTSDELIEMATKGSKRSTGETSNYITVTDASGNPATLRRLTRDVLEDGLPLHFEGLTAAGMDPKGPTAAMNKYVAAVSDYTISATSSISRLRNVSPTAAKLIDLVDPRSGKQGRTNTWTIQERTNFKRGEWDVKLRGIQAKLTPEQEGALMLHMRKVQESEDPVVVEAALGIRGLLKEAHEYSVAAGSKSAYTDDFLPRYYNQKLLKGDPAVRQRMVEALSQVTPRKEADAAKYTPEELQKSILNIAYNRVKTSDEAAHIERGTPINPIGNRSWEDASDAVLHDFLDPEFLGSINRYLVNTASRVEVDRVFGYGGSKLDDMLNLIAKEVEEGRGGGQSLTAREKQSIKDVYDLLNGAYGSVGSRDLKPAVDSAMAFQTVTKLPLVTITSATEPFSALVRLQETGALKILADSYTPAHVRKMWGSRSPQQIEAEVREVGLISDTALKERAHSMMGEGMEGLPAKVTDKAMKLFMLQQFTEHTRVVAYELARNDIVRMAKGLALQPVGRQSATRRRRLTELGLDADAVGTWVLNGANVTDDIYTDIKRASARYTNEIIANPNKVNKGKWTSDAGSLARLTSQFKSFSSTFYNTIATPMITEISKKWNEGNRLGAMRDASAVMVMAGSMSYWAGYKNDYVATVTTGELEVPEHDPVEFSQKMAQGISSYLLPGGYIYGPILSGGADAYSTALGPTGGDLQRVGKAVAQGRPGELLGVVPVAKKVAKSLEDTGPQVR